MISKGFPNVTTSGRQYNIGEKPSVILYTYINLHAGNCCCFLHINRSGLNCTVPYQVLTYYVHQPQRCPCMAINIGTSIQHYGRFLPDSSLLT